MFTFDNRHRGHLRLHNFLKGDTSYIHYTWQVSHVSPSLVFRVFPGWWVQVKLDMHISKSFVIGHCCNTPLHPTDGRRYITDICNFLQINQCYLPFYMTSLYHDVHACFAHIYIFFRVYHYNTVLLMVKRGTTTTKVISLLTPGAPFTNMD